MSGRPALKLALGAATMVVVAALATPAQGQTGVADSQGLVRFVNAAPGPAQVTVGVDDGPSLALALGRASPFGRRAGGRHVVHLGAVDARGLGAQDLGFEVQAGCRHTVAVIQPDGPTSPLRLLDAFECNPARIPDGRASLRFLHATGDGLPAALVAGPSTAPLTAPFTAGARLDVEAGPVRLELRSARGERMAQLGTTLEAGVASTVAWVGGGEIPLRLVVLLDGRQLPQPPPLINTDSPPRSSAPWSPTLLGALLAGGGWAVTRRRGALLVIPALLLMLAACGPGTVTPARPSTPVPGMPAPSPSTSAPTTAAPVAEPAQLEVPTLGFTAAVVAMPVAEAARLPELLGPGDVAWLGATSPPGEMGVSLLAGHVAWGHQPAVFARLAELEPGDPVIVTDTAGTAHRFIVRARMVAPKDAFPPELLAPTPEAVLALVTCAGDIDPATGLRSDNLVLVASVEA